MSGLHKEPGPEGVSGWLDLEALPLMACVLREDGVMLRANGLLRTYLGERCEGESLFALFYGGRVGVPQVWQRVFAEERVEDVPLEGVDAGGAWRGSLWHTRRVASEDGQAVVVALGQRTSASVEELKRLGSQEEVLHQVQEMVVVTDAEGCVVFVNRAFERICGYASAEVLGKKPHLLVNVPEDPKVLQESARQLREGDVLEVCFGMHTRRRGTLEVSAVIAACRGAAGAVTHYVCVTRDISRERSLQKQLQEVQRTEALGHLAAGVAHRFNNVLNGILGQAEMLLGRAEGLDEGQVQRLGQIVEAVERGRALVSGIRNFSKTQDPRRQPLAVGPIVSEAVEFVRSVCPAGIEVRVCVPEVALRVLAVSEEIRQVLLNLMNNAMDAMREKGGVLEVRVEEARRVLRDTGAGVTSPASACVRIAVRDTGPGIDPAIEGELFKPFFTTRNPAEYAGMGLTVAQATVHRCGGVLLFQSAPGQGAVFEVYLPVVGTELPDRENLLGPRGRGERLLLVDGEPFVTEAGAQLLSAQGYRVAVAHSSREVLDKLAHEAPFALLVLAATLPEEAPYALVSRVRDLGYRMPIVVTARLDTPQEPTLLEALDVGRVLGKPCPARELTTAIRALLDGV